MLILVIADRQRNQKGCQWMAANCEISASHAFLCRFRQNGVDACPLTKLLVLREALIKVPRMSLWGKNI